MSDPTPRARGSRPLGLALIAAGLAAGGAALAIGGWGASAWGPRTVPLAAAATLAAAGAAVAVGPFRPAAHPPTAVEGEAPDGASPASGDGATLWLLALGVLYALLIERIGYLAATALAAPGAFWLFGARRPLPLLLAATLAPLALHATFFRLLGVFPPLGAWFDALDHLPL